jgi:hypothetical protein
MISAIFLWHSYFWRGPSWSWWYGSWIYNYLCNRYLSPLMLWVRLATGWWFSPGTLVSSTSKTDSHDISEILLKVALNTITLTLTPDTWLKIRPFERGCRLFQLFFIDFQYFSIYFLTRIILELKKNCKKTTSQKPYIFLYHNFFYLRVYIST